MSQITEADPRVSFTGAAHPTRRYLLVALSALAGFLLTVVWSAEFVDRTIGGTIADNLLGRPARGAPLDTVLAGVAFAFVSGVAGTFTACNVAVFGALGPLVGARSSTRRRLALTLRPLGWLAIGMLTVSATYGIIVGLVGTGMPQFQTAASASALSPRLVQSMIVFGVIGLAMIWLGLAALGLVPDPLARVSSRFPNFPMVFLGGLIGGFLIGRPFPLFRQMFRDAAESHNPLYGAFAFSLQSIGNILIMTLLFTVIVLAAGTRLQRWISARPGRAAALIGVTFLVVGVFTLLYWDVRILARRDMIWYPVAPWA